MVSRLFKATPDDQFQSQPRARQNALTEGILLYVRQQVDILLSRGDGVRFRDPAILEK
jgi:hypothetical protein